MILYLLENRNKNILYIGITSNLKRRVWEHNSPNNNFTGKQQGEWELIGSKMFRSEMEARNEEIRLKKGGNKKYTRWYFEQKSP